MLHNNTYIDLDYDLMSITLFGVQNQRLCLWTKINYFKHFTFSLK
jgi:hypothetical protein